ncbi:MAG TPA: pyridoxamine 5'-phosphate oxidase [Dehalococcoidia bacterium]|nr:pyridoxamine 5'-phosphate oxidase [Dehalococcoidia bacterium]
MLRWSEFQQARPDLVEAGRGLIYHFGLGLGFVATTKSDGGPRMHPVCPIIAGEGLYLFVIPSPKRQDLLRDGRYALHSNPLPDNDDAFYVTGRAERRTDPALREEVAEVYFAGLGLKERWPDFEKELLFELLIETCLLTRTPGHGGPYSHTVWKDPHKI